MTDDLNLLGISGSLRRGSYNTSLLRTIQRMLPDGLSLEIVDWKGLPVYNGDDEDETGIPPSALELVGRIRVAHAVVIATPEYNFSIPGGLKNAIDWVSRVKQQPFRHKRVGIVGASGGPIGTARSQYHLRQTLQALEAYVMPRPEVFVGNAQTKFADDGTLTDEATRKVLETWLKHFDSFIREGGE
jgi:chromate reductase, NAD(P)H dehydrogenase (quinone)